MKIRKSRQVREYASIPNDILRNGQLSFRARGLLGYLLSLPPEWEIRTDDLSDDAPEGRDAVRHAMKELRTAGYVVLNKQQDALGHWCSWLEVFDHPQQDTEVIHRAAQPAAGKPASGATCGNTTSSQVAPDAGKPNVGKPASYIKTVPKDGEKTGEKSGPKDRSPDGARGKPSAADVGWQDRIGIVSAALLAAYGSTEGLSEEEMVSLYDYFIGARKTPVRDPVAYLAKRPFKDAPDVQTLVVKACETAADEAEFAPIGAVRCTDPPLCGNCDNRWVDIGNSVARCPECHPAEVGRAA